MMVLCGMSEDRTHTAVVTYLNIQWDGQGSFLCVSAVRGGIDSDVF